MSYLLFRFLSVSTISPRQPQTRSSNLLRSRSSRLLKTVVLSSCVAFLAATLAPGADAQNTPAAALTPGLLTIAAGSGAIGYTGDNGPAIAATFNDNFGVAVDGSGNIFIADSDNQVIRKVTASTGILTTVAGTGVQGHTGDGGPALQAEFNGPDGLAFDAAGNLYVTELSAVVRKITPAGIITTVAGVYGGPGGLSGDNGPATAAGLNRPYSVYVDAAGDLYIADTGDNVIRRVDAGTGIITTVAGNGYGSNGQVNDSCGLNGFASIGGYTGDGGPATAAELYGPRSMAVNAAGDLYIADSCNNVIRKVAASTGIITTVVGDGFGAGGPLGSGGFSGDGGTATAAELNFPEHILLDGAGDLYIADTENYRIRFVNLAQVISTIAGNGASTAPVSNTAANATGIHLNAIAFDSAYNIYIDDAHDSQILKIDVSQAVVNFPTPTLPGSLDSADGYKSVLVTNVGSGPLSIHGNYDTSFGFVNDLEDLRSDCQSIQPGASCTDLFAFSPTPLQHGGPIDTTAVITDNSPQGKSVVHLSGTAIGTPDFQLEFAPTKVFLERGSQPGYLTSFSLFALPVNGFDGKISVSASNVPAGVLVFFGPPYMFFGIQEVNARVYESSKAAPGVYDVTVTAKSGSLSNSVSIPFVVK